MNRELKMTKRHRISWLSRFKDAKGTAAVEFAFIVPLMIVIYLGIIELTGLLLVERKIVAATETVADLVSQETVIAPSQVDDVIEAARRIFDPYPTTKLTLNISSIKFNKDSGAAELEWQRIVGATEGDSTILSQAEGLGLPGEGVVVVYLTYEYTPIIGLGTLLGTHGVSLNTSSILLDEISFLRPRRTPVVKCTTGSSNCSS